ncbi:MAG: Hypothetical protein BHV28_10520 [Candidatus Tokpelaia hoelldobleri]|uniref:Chromosomal replication initiator protein DnaA domain-containing protein n=1 Tax=Candidatus Tokpelaia hoelldobleri TaxID=1902579 RepID=A0A1U9JV41_9HYPH|nr:MAG: Hypothetical protein BHV28_10520 [Candidatus Tokpelaia hoelldoblerii]
MRITPRQLPLALEPAGGFSIDDFVVTAANRAPFELLEAWPQWPSPVVALVGAKGSGKSHLAAIWAAQSFARQFEPGRLGAAIEAAAQGKPVFLEDMAAGMFDETELFHLINTVRQGKVEFPSCALLMTSQRRPVDWDVALPDLASRLKAVPVVELAPPDEILLRMVLAKLFADRQLYVEPQVFDYSVNRIDRSLEAAVQLVQAVDRLALEKKSRVTRQLVADVLSKMYQDVDDKDCSAHMDTQGAFLF